MSVINHLSRALHALRADIARIHRHGNCSNANCSCRSGRPVRDAAGFIKQHLWADPIIAFGKRHFTGYYTRSFFYFLASPVYYAFSATSVGVRIYGFFYELRPSVRASRRATYYEQGAGFIEYHSFGGVTDSLETRLPNEH